MNIVLMISLCLVSADFPVCTATNHQCHPRIIFENDQYYVFWADYRYYSPDYTLFGARISEDGTVIDPNGKVLFRNQAAYEPAMAYDGSNFLLAIRDSC
jgi:hypothetical protein